MEPDPVVGKAIETVVQNMATIYKAAVQQPGKVPPEAIGQLMAAMAEVENQWNAPAPADPQMPPGGDMAMDPGMDPAAMEDPSMMDPAMAGAEMPMPEADFMQVENPEQQAGSFDEAAAALHDATKRDARKRGVQ